MIRTFIFRYFSIILSKNIDNSIINSINSIILSKTIDNIMIDGKNYDKNIEIHRFERMSMKGSFAVAHTYLYKYQV